MTGDGQVANNRESKKSVAVSLDLFKSSKKWPRIAVVSTADFSKKEKLSTCISGQAGGGVGEDARIQIPLE
jgi:hypothetical protein